MFGAWGEFTPVNRAAPDEGFMMRNQQGWVETGQAGLGEPPFSAAAQYATASPWLAADHISSPVLLITADMDFVTTSQSERMFSALSRLGQRARLVTYWGEEHFNWSPANIRDLYGQIFDWLELTLTAEDIPGQPAKRERGRSLTSFCLQRMPLSDTGENSTELGVAPQWTTGSCP
jgi:acetyl esterase/lipase